MRLVAAAAGRADKILGDAVADTSRRLLARAFAEGQVRVNGRRARKGDRVAPGDVIELAGSVEREALAPEPQPELALAVLWQDEHLVAVDKPPGLPSMPLRAGERGTLANALVARFPECVAAGEDPREAGLAHRLDTGTSGVLLAARTRHVWSEVRRAFSEGRVRKEYLALVEGELAGEQIVDEPIAHVRGGAGGVRAGGPGLPAATQLYPERRLGPYTLVRCVARTGRMHQVRAHLAAAGIPCVGDERYGAAPSALETGGPFLHAARVELAHPVTGVVLAIVAPLPPGRARLLEELTPRSR